MGSLLPILLTFLFIQETRGQVEFLSLPDTVSIKESSAIGTSVHKFSLLNCTNNNPTVTISKVTPTATYFNTPTQTLAGSAYNLEITLSSTASLNAQVVNEYVLEITAVCGTDTVTGQLFVNIIDDLPEPQCDPKFASQTGDEVQIYSNVPASSGIYTVVLRQPKNSPASFRITSPSPSPFTISSPSGTVYTPAAGFTNVDANYQLQIEVRDSAGNTCNGTLNVIVYHVYQNTVNFTTSSYKVTIPENGGPGYLVTIMKANGNSVLYELVNPSTIYYIETVSGTIRTTATLDLDTNPSLVTTILEVRAYNLYQHSDSATATVTITVTDVNDIAPQCSPAIVVAQVPEDSPVGGLLATFSCTDPDYNSTALTYSIISNANSLYSFRMIGSRLEINTTLDYDSYAIAAMNFQYSATVVVTDNGTPKMTTNIPVFITVTPVNDFKPVCVGPSTFSISENAAFGTVVGQYNATDADYPFNNVQYSIEGAASPPVFYIVPATGVITLLGPLDYETKTSYSLRIRVVDLNNDIQPDPNAQRSESCPITINVQDYNDNPPTCNPPFASTWIYSTLLTTTPLYSLSCSDKDVSTTGLFYSIVGGNEYNRFRMVGNNILHNPFSYNTAGGIYEPTKYQLLIQVTDSTTSPQYSTTATVFITVVPWTTTQPTTTSTTPVPVKQTTIVNQTLEYWQPDIWFMVVLTITGALTLAAIALLTWALCTKYPLCARSPTEATQPLLQDGSLQNVESAAKQNQQPPPPSKEKDVAPVSPLSLQFDGRAQDPVTGREYLFNSHTGERRWI